MKFESDGNHFSIKLCSTKDVNNKIRALIDELLADFDSKNELIQSCVIVYDYKDPNGTNFKDKYEQDFKVLITGDISVEL